MVKGGSRHMMAISENNVGGTRRREAIPSGEEGFFMETLAPREGEINQAVFMDNLSRRVPPDKQPDEIIIQIEGTTDHDTVKGDGNFGTRNQPGRKEGEKGIWSRRVLLGIGGKIRIESFVR